MPPENFLEQFVELYATADKALSTALDSPEESRAEAIRLGVRHHLRIVAYLAKKFDGDRQARYAANIMIFRAADRLSTEQIADHKRFLRFCDPSTDCRLLLGLLELVQDFSSTDDDKLEPDDQVRKIVLPIPIQQKNHQDRWLVLPGAPLAFVTRKASAFADTRAKLREWLDNEGDFQELVKNDLESYFVDSPNLRSFVSIPILPPEGLYSSNRDDSPLPIGVLNIHVDSPGLLRGADWAEPRGSAMSHFNAIIQPFSLNLVKLLKHAGDSTDTVRTAIEAKS